MIDCYEVIKRDEAILCNKSSSENFLYYDGLEVDDI